VDDKQPLQFAPQATLGEASSALLRSQIILRHMRCLMMIAIWKGPLPCRHLVSFRSMSPLLPIGVEPLHPADEGRPLELAVCLSILQVLHQM